MISVILAVCGLYLLCMTDGNFSIGKGDIFTILCALAFSLQILSVDHFAPKVDCVKLASLQFLVCGICSCVPMLLFEHPHFAQLAAAWMPILYAGILSNGVAYTLQIVAQKGLNPTVASLIMSLESVISVLAGWFILHQTLTKRELIGKETGESPRQVLRYIRLTLLVPELLDMLDEGKISFNPAVELSFLSEVEQKLVLNGMDYAQAAPSVSQAKRIKALSQEKKLTQQKINKISVCRCSGWK